MHTWQALALFSIEALIIVVAILVVIAGMVALLSKNKGPTQGRLVVTKLNDTFGEQRDVLLNAMKDKAALKASHKADKAAKKARVKQDRAKQTLTERKRVFVLEFCGDIKASQVAQLREEVTAVLHIIQPSDEVVIKLESPGGVVHGYGLAASQLARLRERHIPLTVCIDKVAASGGYLMACVANQIIAAPFAIIGSIGVVAQIPNVHRLLKKHDIDFEQITAGEFKRTLTVFGENTDKARDKMREDMQEIHTAFKDYILQNRAGVDMAQVATGEHWLASDAIKLKLVDRLMTSDDYLLYASLHADVFQLSMAVKRSLSQKLGLFAKTYLSAW